MMKYSVINIPTTVRKMSYISLIDINSYYVNVFHDASIGK